MAQGTYQLLASVKITAGIYDDGREGEIQRLESPLIEAVDWEGESPLKIDMEYLIKNVHGTAT